MRARSQHRHKNSRGLKNRIIKAIVRSIARNKDLYTNPVLT